MIWKGWQADVAIHRQTDTQKMPIGTPEVNGVELKPYLLKPQNTLPSTGVGYFFGHPKTAHNSNQFLAPSPSSTSNLQQLFLPK